MKYLGAYMLAVLGGNSSPDAGDIKKILASVGAEVDDSVLERVMGELSGKDVFDVISQGREKLSSVPAGGGAVAAAGGAAAAPAEEKEEEAPKEESEEEEEEELGFDLFD